MTTLLSKIFAPSASQLGGKPEQSLEDIMCELAKYGEPSLTRMRNGNWWCYIEMHSIAIGSTFQIKSEHIKERSPRDTALECLERVKKAVRQLGNGA